MSDTNWVGVGFSVFLIIIIVYVVPMTIIIPIMELQIPTESKCNDLNNKTWYLNDSGNITFIEILNETSWCTRNETGWHLNITKWDSVGWI